MTTLNAQLELLQPGDVALMGVPLDENSSFLRGPAQAPLRIRKARIGESVCGE
jgi:arginase